MAVKTLHICRGVPASGKTTFALEWIKDHPERVRVNRDDLRMALFGRYTGVNEQVVTTAQHAIVTGYMNAGLEIIVDDTNLVNKFVKQWLKLAREHGYTVQFHDFPVLRETAHARDNARGINGDRFVGPLVIESFFDRFIKNGVDLPGLPRLDPDPVFEHYVPNLNNPLAVIFDVDNTLALNINRDPYDTSKYATDVGNGQVIGLANMLRAQGYKIIITSGRDREFQGVTEQWLADWGVEYDDIFMRHDDATPSGGKLRDDIMKYRLLTEEIAPKYAVMLAVDDRVRVVQMWRAVGLECWQVNEGDF